MANGLGSPVGRPEERSVDPAGAQPERKTPQPVRPRTYFPARGVTRGPTEPEAHAAAATKEAASVIPAQVTPSAPSPVGHIASSYDTWWTGLDKLLKKIHGHYFFGKKLGATALAIDEIQHMSDPDARDRQLKRIAEYLSNSAENYITRIGRPKANPSPKELAEEGADMNWVRKLQSLNDELKEFMTLPRPSPVTSTIPSAFLTTVLSHPATIPPRGSPEWWQFVGRKVEGIIHALYTIDSPIFDTLRKTVATQNLDELRQLMHQDSRGRRGLEGTINRALETLSIGEQHELQKKQAELEALLGTKEQPSTARGSRPGTPPKEEKVAPSEASGAAPTDHARTSINGVEISPPGSTSDDLLLRDSNGHQRYVRITNPNATIGDLIEALNKDNETIRSPNKVGRLIFTGSKRVAVKSGRPTDEKQKISECITACNFGPNRVVHVFPQLPE